MGKDSVSSGSVDFTVKSKSPFAVMANPIGDTVDPEKGFGVVLDHLTKNPAIGRRFGIIAYSKKYATISTRSTPESMDRWRVANTFFRAVEQYAKEKLIEIYQNPEIWHYLSSPIEGYEENAKKLTKEIGNQTIKTFLREHAGSGQNRIRAATLSASVADNLNDIALGIFSIESIIEHAKELTPGIIDINFQSMAEMAANLNNELQFYAEQWLRVAPDYLKEIVYCVEEQRKKGLLGNTFYINSTDYKPRVTKYKTITECVMKLNKRKTGIPEYNDWCQRLFGFMLKPEGRDLEIILIETLPLNWLVIPSTDSTNSTDWRERQNNINESESVKGENVVEKFDNNKITDKILPSSQMGETVEMVEKRLSPFQRMKKVLDVIKLEHGCTDDYIVSRTKLTDEQVQEALKALQNDRSAWCEGGRIWREVTNVS